MVKLKGRSIKTASRKKQAKPQKSTSGQKPRETAPPLKVQKARTGQTASDKKQARPRKNVSGQKARGTASPRKAQEGRTIKPASRKKQAKPRKKVGEQRLKVTATSSKASMEPGGLPRSYGKTKVVLLPVDPYLVHCYWEVSSSDFAPVDSRPGKSNETAQGALRFHQVGRPVGEFGNTQGPFDVDIHLDARNWYVRLPAPEGTYYVELGFRTSDGKFSPIARSENVEIPHLWPSTRVEDRYTLVTEEPGAPKAGGTAQGQGVTFVLSPEPRTAGQESTPNLPLAGPVRHLRRTNASEEGPSGIANPNAGRVKLRGQPRTTPQVDMAEIVHGKMAELYGLTESGRMPGFNDDASTASGQAGPQTFDFVEWVERELAACCSSGVTSSRPSARQ